MEGCRFSRAGGDAESKRALSRLLSIFSWVRFFLFHDSSGRIASSALGLVTPLTNDAEFFLRAACPSARTRRLLSQNTIISSIPSPTGVLLGNLLPETLAKAPARDS